MPELANSDKLRKVVEQSILWGKNKNKKLVLCLDKRPIDLTKNICEVFGSGGYLRTAYSYAPFGAVSASGDVTQPFQWSSEVYDSELDLVYYNFRHYSPSLGRFLSRDPIEEQGGWNLYAFVGNNGIKMIDLLGQASPSLGRHIGPAWLRRLLGVPDEDLTEWFSRRFPNALESAKSKMREKLAYKICASRGVSMLPNNSTTWEFGGDDFAKYGDKNMSFYEKYLLMGHFNIFTKDISVRWASKCDFSWEATFYFEDRTGSNYPSVDDFNRNFPAFLIDAFIHWTPWISPILSYIFSPRAVVMGEWLESGIGSCNSNISAR